MCAGSLPRHYTPLMSNLERLRYALPSWRSIAAPRWLPPPRPWWPLSRTAFYACCMGGTGLIAAMRWVDIPSLIALAYFSAGTGVTIAESRLRAPT